MGHKSKLHVFAIVQTFLEVRQYLLKLRSAPSTWAAAARETNTARTPNTIGSCSVLNGFMKPNADVELRFSAKLSWRKISVPPAQLGGKTSAPTTG